MALRGPPWAPLGPVRAPSIHASVRGQRKPHPSALAMRLAPGGTGSSGSYGNKTTPAGAWLLHSCPQRPVIGSKRLAATPGTWPGWPARGLSPSSLDPKSTMTPCARARGRVQMPSASCKTPSSVSKLSCCATLAATLATPPGTRPLSEGARRASGRPRRRTASCKQMAAPGLYTPHASSGSTRTSQSGSKPGASTLWWKPCRPGWGLQGPVAVTTVAESGALTRCDPPRERLQFFGLLPSDYARGERRRHGALPHAGHPQARRVLGEGAWAYRSPAQVRRPLQRRLEQPPQASPAIRGKAQGRRWKRDRQLMELQAL
jgi:transposase IS116/IS110/IS902 family protein